MESPDQCSGLDGGPRRRIVTGDLDGAPVWLQRAVEARCPAGVAFLAAVRGPC